jgi:hypothetical protein
MGDDENNNYQNCQTQCPNCMRLCDRQTDVNGKHQGTHHCTTHGNYQ